MPGKTRAKAGKRAIRVALRLADLFAGEVA